MFKYYLKYILKSGEEKFVAGVKNNTSIQFSQEEPHATIFYGADGLFVIKAIIQNDLDNKVVSDTTDYQYEIIEKESAPEHYFELINAISNEFGLDRLNSVPKDFPLNKDVLYEAYNSDGLPVIDNLSINELQRLYVWLLNNQEKSDIAAIWAQANNLKINVPMMISKQNVK